jgi:hypothetical protein
MFKLTGLLIALLSLLFVQGCGGMDSYSVNRGYATPQKNPFEIADENYRNCQRQLEPYFPPYRSDVIVLGPNDPDLFNKLSSTRQIDESYKQYLLVTRQISQICDQQAIRAISEISAYHTPVVVDSINKTNFLILEVMQGKIKNFGEYNTLYKKIGDEAQVAWLRANADFNRQSQQELAARRAEALQRLQVWNALQQQTNQTWMNMAPKQNNVYQYKPPVNTNCYYIGNSMTCNSSQLGTLNNSTTNCYRIGNSIQCNSY